MSKKILNNLFRTVFSRSPIFLKFAVPASVVFFSAAVFIFSSELSRVVDDYYDDKTVESSASNNVREEAEEVPVNPEYEYGDWEKNIHDSRRSWYTAGSSGNNEDILIEFRMPVSLSYGRSFFTDSKYLTDDGMDPSSSEVTDGYNSELNYMLKVNGNVNESLYLNIDHDSSRENSDENVYEVIYNSPDPNSFLQQFRLGNIQVDFNSSQFVFYDNSSQRATGFSSLFKKNDMTLEIFGIINDSLSQTDVFTGFKRKDSIRLREYQFVRRKYYQLEPYKRYDARTALFDITHISTRLGLVAFTSDPATASTPITMSDYFLSSVNVLSGSVEIYRDDQVGSNNSHAVQFSADDGYYDRLSSGVDYGINNITGEIEFYSPLGRADRVIVLYQLADSLYSDPSALDYSGKKLVFIKYGESLSTVSDDAPSRGYDVYEIRSRYFLGNAGIVPGSCTIVFNDDNGTLDSSRKEILGKYGIDYAKGYLKFDLREPFRTNLDDKDEDFIYSQTEISGIYNYSAFSFENTYNLDSGEVKLSHMDIVPESVSVRVDKSPVALSLYTVDCTGGIVSFDDNFVELVPSSALVEISYQYRDSGVMESSFTAGARMDYRLNRNINLGASVLYSRDSSVYEIPDIDAAPASILVGEGDVTLDYSSGQMTKLLKSVLGKKEFPFAYRGYCEYARSVMTVNTFGYGLVDDFDSPGYAAELNLDDDEWILSSPPSGENQSTRTQLLYRYYRDPDDGYTLKGEGFSPYSIDYSIKPGPYNIAEGFLGKEDLSLVLDFDFNGSDSFASVVTRRLDEQQADFSSLQYIEIIYRSAGGSGSVDLALDLGKIDEDSDSDGILDTEDVNGNGYLDFDPDSEIFEDRGFVFNPAAEQQTYVGGGPRISYQTKGDGKLTSEDLNGNSLLETAEEFITFPSAASRTTVNGTTGAFVLTVDMTDTAWKKTRIYLDRSSMTQTEIENTREILRKCEALRVHAAANNAAVDEGRIYINSINLVMLDWNEIRIDGVETNDPSKLKVSYLDTSNDSEYVSASFMKQKKDVYEKLYASSEGSNVTEGALEIAYDSLDGSPPNGSVARKFSRSVDFSNYGTLNLWINARSYTPGDYVEIIFGKSSSSYYVYTYDFSSSSSWTQIEMNLDGSSSGGISCTSRIGSPRLNEINFFQIKINGVSGRFWVNNIYVSDPKDVTGQAFYAENSLKSDRPLLTSSGVKYLNNTQLKHVFKYVEGTFMSPQRDDYGDRIVFNNVEFATDPFEKMNTSVSYSRENRNDDSHNSSSRTDTLNFFYGYMPDMSYYPDFGFKYRLNDSDMETEESISAAEYSSDRRLSAHSFYTEFYRNNIITGDTVISYHASVGTDLSKDRLNRDLLSGLAADIETDTCYMEQKNRYSAGVEISNNDYAASVQSSLANSMINSYSGFDIQQSDPVQRDFSGKFYFPLYFDDSNYKLVSRSNSVSINLEYRKPESADVIFFNSLNSSEYGFSDYTAGVSAAQHFSRERSLSMTLDSRLDVPFSLYDSRFNLTFTYEKNSSLTDNNSPYEGENTPYFSERYGAEDQFGDLKNCQYDYSSYYPFYYLTGSSFMLNGRKVGEDVRNTYPGDSALFPEYDNSFETKDVFSADSSWDSERYSLSYALTLTNFCKRSNVDAVPGQNFSVDNNLSVELDLLRIFRLNHSEIMNLDFEFTYSFTDYMLITQNIVEYDHSPGISLIYDRKMYGIKASASFTYRLREDREFIEYGITDSGNPDFIYSQNLSGGDFSEDDRTYELNVTYFKKLDFSALFPEWKPVDDFPVLTVDGGVILNDYDYQNSISPEPYDKYSLKADVSYTVYRYTTVNLYGLTVLENYYNRETGGMYKQIISYEVGAGLQVIF